MANGKYYMILEPASRKQGQRFKNVCRKQGVSMRFAFIAFMNSVIDGEYDIQARLKKNGDKR